MVAAASAAGARDGVAREALVRGVPGTLRDTLGSGAARLVELDIRDREAVATAIRRSLIR